MPGTPSLARKDPGGWAQSLWEAKGTLGAHRPRQVCSRPTHSLIFHHPPASRGRDGWAPGLADCCEITQRPDKP